MRGVRECGQGIDSQIVVMEVVVVQVHGRSLPAING